MEVDVFRWPLFVVGGKARPTFIRLADGYQADGSGSESHVLVMKAAEVGQGNHLTYVGPLDGPTIRCILVQRQVRARRMIVPQVGSDDPSQMLLVKHDHVVEALRE